MEFLHYLDVAIGFTLAMMVLATLIGTASAAWLAAIQSRVRQLENGLQQVLSGFGDTLSSAERLEAVQTLLRDDMMNTWAPIRRLGFGAAEAIGREEFVLMLLRRAGTSPTWQKVGAAIEAVTHQPVEFTLRAVEKAILEEEIAAPNAPATVTRTRALAQTAPDLTARLFSQFDDVMTRTDDNTAYSAKFVSVVFTAIFLVLYPVDSFDVLARLINSDAVTQSLIKSATAANVVEEVKNQGVFGEVFSRPPQFTPSANPGILTTFALVSLGAPFWQRLLDKLLGLRSRIVEKTEEERAFRTRQT